MRPCLLFDLDGTLVHTDHLHFEAFRELRARDGETFTDAEFKARVLGRPNEAIFKDYYPHLDGKSRQALCDAKEARVRDMIGNGSALAPTLGLISLLDWADHHHVPYAIVTNAPPANAESMLRASGLTSRFPIIISGEVLPHGKPHPLPYLEGLRLTGGVAENAYAFEDSIAGLSSAVAAQIACAGIGQSVSAEALISAGASLVAKDFTNARLIADIRTKLGLS